MSDHKSPDEKENQSNGSEDESFDVLLQKKVEAEQKLEKKFLKVMTLMQSDIKGSTEFQQTRGDIESAALLDVHKRLLDPILSKYCGKVISDATDGAFVAFEKSPEDAVKAAIEFMRDVHKHNESSQIKLNIRIAMNHGQVVAKSDKHLTGLTVSSTARVEQSMKAFEKQNDEIANTSLIFISGSLYNELRNSEDIMCRWVEQVEAKGLDKPLDLYRVVWDPEQEQTIFKSTISSRETRGQDTGQSKHAISAAVKRNTFVVEIAREKDKIKISGYEKAEQEQKTVRHYDKVKIDNDKIEKNIQKIITLLNLGTHSGSIDKAVLNNLKSAGQVLFDEIFTETIKSKIANTTSEDLILNIDDQLVHIPWELLYDGTSFLSLRFNMGRVVSTRQAISEGASRPISLPLKMLVLSDPRNNLKTASKEGHDIQSELESMSSQINVNVKSGDIKSSYVVEKIHNFDIVHYAGHSDYDSENPALSGWLLNDKKLDAEKIRMMGGSQPMPALVFSNACQSGQTDKWELSDDYENKIYGMANAFLLAGVNHYVGTFWEILDEPSSNFAISFYEHMSNNKSIGEAVRLARKELIKKYGEETIIWASYMLYGDPSFCYVNPNVQEEPLPAEKEQLVYADAGGDLRGSGAVATGMRPIYWIGGITAFILIILAVFFFSGQTKQTDMLVKSIQDTRVELAKQKAEQSQGENARLRQITDVEEKEKSRRIDALVAELASRYKEGQIADTNKAPVDEWVSRPLVVSLFPLKINLNNYDINQDLILDQFAEFFGNSGRIRLVDRELIDKLLEELRLSSSDLVDGQTALRIGKLIGARFIASGSVFSIEDDIRLSMKLIETETTSIVKTKSQTGKGAKSLPTLTESIAQEFLDVLISKFPLRARIAGFNGDNVIINIGENQGMAKGIKFNVFQEQTIEADMVIKENVGTIEVKNVEENVSTGIVLTKTAEFEKDMKLDEAL